LPFGGCVATAKRVGGLQVDFVILGVLGVVWLAGLLAL